MTVSRIQALESLGFKWDGRFVAGEERLSELIGCRKIHKH
jgi:hypothetical protein